MVRADDQWNAREVARLLGLAEAQRRYYEGLAETLPVPVALLAADKTLVWANRSFRTKSGLRTDDLRGKTLEQAGFNLGIMSVPLPRWDNEDEIETLVVVEGIAGGAVEGHAPVVPSGIPAIVWQADSATLRFRSVSGSALEMLGYPVSQWLNRTDFFEGRIHPDDRAATMELYRSTIASGGEAAAEYRAISAAGAAVWCRERIRATAGRLMGVITNITQRKQLEQQALSAGRFDALYTFAGRVAHDLNNPLMIVAGYTAELVESLKPTDPLRKEAAEILSAAERISGLAAQLVDFARKHARPAGRVNIGEVVARAKRSLSKAVELTANPAPVWAAAEAEQLGEVIGAVVSGSQDAARITISWDVETITEQISGALGPGRYARIAIHSDGQGVEADKQAGIFDPVPTKGTATEALALSRAYAIVREWGGDISFTGDASSTTFCIYLRVAEAEAAPAAVKEPAPKRGRETILIVEDEDGIRGLILKILRRERYQVLEAASAEEALALVAAHKSSIHLLITDVMLTGMSGPDLALKMHAASPGLKVLYISGYTDDETARSGAYPPGARFLAKPFTLGVLLGKVRETLDE